MKIEISYNKHVIVNGIDENFDEVIEVSKLAEISSIDGIDNEAFKASILKIGAHPANSRNGKTRNVRGILSEAYFSIK